MPVLPRLKNYDDVYAQFRWQVPARYNIGVDVCDRWAAREPDRLAILHVHPDGREDAVSYGALRDTSNRLANALRAQGVARGDRVAILLPQAPEVAASHIAIYKLGAVALPLATLFGIDALSYRLQNSGASALITNAQGVARIAEIRDELPDLKLVLSIDGAARRRRARFRRDPGARLVRLHAGRHRSRRSGHDDLHLGHHRAAERRAACASRADRTFPRHRDASRLLPAAGRPHLDAGRLGLGRRAARCAAAEPALRRAGGGAPLREVRSGGSLRADGAHASAQHLHPADRAAHDARGAQSARPLRHQAALDRLGRRDARRGNLRVGQVRLRPHHQRILRPDRMQPGAVGLQRARRLESRRHRQAGSRPYAWR